MTVTAPLPASPPQLIRSAQIVGALSVAASAFLLLVGKIFMPPEERLASVAVGTAIFVVSSGWALFMALKALRIAGPFRRDDPVLALSIIGMLALISVTGLLSLANPLAPELFFITCAVLSCAFVANLLTVRFVQLREKASSCPNAWTPQERLATGEPYLRRLHVLALFLVILPTWFVVCARSTSPEWHVGCMANLPNPLRNMTYRTLVSFSMQNALIERDALAPEVLEEEILKPYPDFFRINAFESLARQDTQAAYKLAERSLRETWPMEPSFECCVKTVTPAPGWEFRNPYSLHCQLAKHVAIHASVEQLKTLARDPAVTERYSFALLAAALTPSKKLWIDTELRAVLSAGSTPYLLNALMLDADTPEGLQRCTAIWDAPAPAIKQYALHVSSNLYPHEDRLLAAGLVHPKARGEVLTLLFSTPVAMYNRAQELSLTLVPMLKDSDLKTRRMTTQILAKWWNYIPQTAAGIVDPSSPSPEAEFELKDREELRKYIEALNMIACKNG